MQKDGGDLRERTKEFALRVIRDVLSIAEIHGSPGFSKQVLRSGTSVGANYP